MLLASELRIGLGLDAHALEEGVPLVLGGVEIEHPRGLAGHSDGDVITHALIDALLGAAGLGDIGSLFPSGDERWHGADSLDLLRDAYSRVREAGYALVNADCVLVGEEPRIAPHRDEMRRRLADALAVDPAIVNVRATTTDRLGFTGPRRGARRRRRWPCWSAREARSLRRPARPAGDPLRAARPGHLPGVHAQQRAGEQVLGPALHRFPRVPGRRSSTATSSSPRRMRCPSPGTARRGTCRPGGTRRSSAG